MRMLMVAPLVWFVAFFCLRHGFKLLSPVWRVIQESWGIKKRIRNYQFAAQKLFQLQEVLASGLVPETHEWQQLETLPAPWNHISYRSVLELRDQGAPVLPTLKRVRAALEEQIELMQESQARSAQAWSQAILGVILVPVFAFVLYGLLPEIQDSAIVFFSVSGLALFLTGLAVIWISLMIDQARYGGVKRDHQSWYGSTLASMERLWALIQIGFPPDLAWKSMIDELVKTDAPLAQTWGSSVWSSEIISHQQTAQTEFERMMVLLGQEMKKSIQVSLIEGRGCLERMESIHRSFLTEYRLKLLRQLNLLPNRCLKPLFIFLFPAMFLILFTGLGLSVSHLGISG